MKCVLIHATREVLRMDDMIALVFVTAGVASYTNRQAWKKQGRIHLDPENAKAMLKDLKKKDKQYANT